MSAPAAPATSPDPGPQAPATPGYREVLDGLIGLGASFARILHGQAAALAEPPASTQPAAAPPAASAAIAGLAAVFDKVARTVRRCIMLALRLGQPAPDPARERAAARKRILREVEDTIQRPSDNPGRDADDTLHAELRERLDAPDLDEDLATRPVPDIIRDICRDLGLGAYPGTRPFKRRTPADVAQLCARAAAPPGAPEPGAAPRGAVPPPAPGPAASPAPGSGRDAASARPGNALPDDMAAAVAAVLRHPGPGRWRPPLGG